MEAFCRANWKAGIAWVGIAAPLLLCGTTAITFAGDMSLRFGATQSTKFIDNFELIEDGQDAALTSSTFFNLDFLNLGKTYKMEFTPGLSIQKTFFNESPESWKYFPSAGLALEKSTKRTTYDFVASVARSQVSTNDLIEDIITTNKGDRLDYSFATTISHKISEIDNITWSNSAKFTDYSVSGPALVPFRNFNSEARWHHQLSELVGHDLGISADYYLPKTGEKRSLYRATSNFNARLTKRFALNARLGLLILDAQNANLSADGLFGVTGTYNLKNTDYTASFSRDIYPGVNGNLLNSLSGRIGVNHQINDLMSAGVSAGYIIQSSDNGSKSKALTISPVLKYQLAKEWNSVLSYQFVHSLSDTATTYSNAVTLSLSYNTTLLP